MASGREEIQNLAASLSKGAIFSTIHTSIALLILFVSNYVYALGKFHLWPLLVYLVFGIFVNFSISSKKQRPPLKPKESVKLHKLFKVASVLLCSVIVFYVVAVLFGAPFFSSQEETLMFSVLTTILVVFPLILNVGIDATISILSSGNVFEKDPLHSIFSIAIRIVLFGAWLGAVVIPLDWDKPWQVWPIPCSLGALFGYLISQLFILCLNLPKIAQTLNQVLIKKGRKYEL